MSKQCIGELVFNRYEGGKAIYKCRLCGHEESREVKPERESSSYPPSDYAASAGTYIGQVSVMHVTESGARWYEPIEDSTTRGPGYKRDAHGYVYYDPGP